MRGTFRNDSLQGPFSPSNLRLRHPVIPIQPAGEFFVRKLNVDDAPVVGRPARGGSVERERAQRDDPARSGEANDLGHARPPLGEFVIEPPVAVRPRQHPQRAVRPWKRGRVSLRRIVFMTPDPFSFSAGSHSFAATFALSGSTQCLTSAL